MRFPTGSTWLALLVASSNLSCITDNPDAIHQCDVNSPNDTWSRNNVDMQVSAPICPVMIPSSKLVFFSTSTTAPSNMPRPETSYYTDFFDAASARLESFVSPWFYQGNNRNVANTTGYYTAGRAGFPAGAINIQDVAKAGFSTTPAYGSATAIGYALLPYKFTGTTPAIKMSASVWNQPKVGNTSFLRVVPQINESSLPVRSFSWQFDGKPVVDTAVSRDPRYPIYWSARVYRAKVSTRGTHVWKVSMTYGTWPNELSATITWNQTWY